MNTIELNNIWQIGINKISLEWPDNLSKKKRDTMELIEKNTLRIALEYVDVEAKPIADVLGRGWRQSRYRTMSQDNPETLDFWQGLLLKKGYIHPDDKSNIAKVRRCMTCSTKMISRHSGERICKSCKNTEFYKSA